ncbi:hypothetical protein GCM10011609_88340 [Lentzea pudingi]|uniref:OmpR/PhoB-type domain-containing protein n=1 Tax=Lentzea pudingi TaxID=1789439 RepID=A0ABQ2IX42_9PSEU|nr:AfsR/SARP family transcriptional regulator [Lentzea pudingi]GGN30508.1 hypothetical protein GCM10011609_88340 [Lentzea pudingi]
MTGDDDIRIRLLGTVEVRTDRGWITPPGRKVRILLSVLAERAGLPVPVERIIDALWSDAPPERARGLVHTYVSNLRALVAPMRVPHVGDGYVLEVERSAVDCHVFASLVESGLAAIRIGHVADGVAELRAAEAQWRGPALAGADGGWVERWRTRLHEARLEAIESRVEATVDSAPAVAELRALIDEHPLRESLRALLVRTLHREGRTDAALAAFADGRAVLVRELAAEPGTALRAARDLVVSSAATHNPTDAEHMLDLGDRCYREDRFAEASVHYSLAVDRYGEAGDQIGAAQARLTLGVVQREWGLFDASLSNLSSAVAVLRTADDGRLLAQAARSRGMVHAERGRFDEAMDGYREGSASRPDRRCDGTGGAGHAVDRGAAPRGR